MRRERFYKWLGFRECRAPMPPEKPGMQPGCGSSRVVFDLTFTDRLRVLVSGKIMCDLAHKMDRMPKRWETTSAYSVLAPNWNGPGANADK